VYYKTIGITNLRTPIIGWVGNNGSVTTDELFYLTYNGTQSFNQSNINGKFLIFDLTGLALVNPSYDSTFISNNTNKYTLSEITNIKNLLKNEINTPYAFNALTNTQLTNAELSFIGFSFAPTISSISPFFGYTYKSTPVTITGTNLNYDTTVSFDDSSVSIIDISGTVIRFNAPPHPSGNIQIIVTTIFGSSNGTFTYIQYPCFKQDTKILTNNGYIPVQNLKKGDLIKTLLHEYKPIFMIGKKEIYHPAAEERIKDQLYQCSQKEYPELFEPLIITGCHCILVDNFTNEEQKQKVREVNGHIYVTDNKYRLPSCADPRASIYEKPGTYTIYHFSLENDDYYMNYGVYANGLLVETCSKRYLKELSNMTLIE
jgi:hypothetical protein